VTTHAIEHEARKVLAAALEGASQLLVSHRADLRALEAALLERETLEKDELRALFAASGQRPSLGPASPSSAPRGATEEA
jgi:ATP-dependent Zn protease